MAPASTPLLKPLLTSALFFLLFTHAPTCNAQLSSTQSILYSGQTLKTGERLVEGPYSFIMQEDCNLVLYNNGVPYWHTNTGIHVPRNCHLTFQSNGNLEVLTPQGRRMWASNSARGPGNYVLILQKDRNVVIHGPSIWTTNINLPTLNRNGVMMSAVIVNALDETNNGTTKLIKTVV